MKQLIIFLLFIGFITGCANQNEYNEIENNIYTPAPANDEDAEKSPPCTGC